MTETVSVLNLETGERVEVTEDSAKKLLERDNFVPDEGTEKSSWEIGEAEKLGEQESENDGDGDVWSEIEEELDKEQPSELPPKWKPSKEDDHPDKLIGTIDRTGPDNYGETFIVEDLDGDEWFIPSGRKALEDFIKKAEVGDKVGLRFLGVEKSGETGREYENYRTVVKKSS